MVNCFLKIYDYFQSRRPLCLGLLALLMMLFIGLTLTLHYKEDIYDFLPFTSERQKEMRIYQGISQADRVVVIFEQKDTLEANPEMLGEAVDRFASIVQQVDSGQHIKGLTTSIDYGMVLETMDFIYQNIPYFLTSDDYARLDTLITPDYIKEQLVRDKEMLLFPTGGLLSENIQRDPLNLFTPTVGRLQQVQANVQFETSDGYIYSPDYRRAYVLFTTPHGSSETSENGKLVELLDEVMHQVETEFSDVELHSIGASVIAVANASQIKKDSVLAVCISFVLILLLLLRAFRKVKNLALILTSVLVGGCFATACLALIHDSVSIIVLGISSVIIGIAVNYPLHLFTHLRHTPHVRTTLKEIISPLLIGNITTVGAFLCLVPLDSSALRDLGLFSSFMLIGTILYVIIFLPHLIKDKCVGEEHEASDSFLSKISGISFESKPWLIVVIAVLTFVFGYFSMFTSFDADISHINYMTDKQRADMQEIQGQLSQSDKTTIYVASEGRTLDEATCRSEKAQSALSGLVKGGQANRMMSATGFIPSQEEQAHRLALWSQLMEDKKELLTTFLTDELNRQGFNPSSFADFYEVVAQTPAPLDSLQNGLMVENVFSSYVLRDTSGVTVVDMLEVPSKDKDAIKSYLNETVPDSHAFDIQAMNSEIANALSDDFNYIVFSCGFIVFAFLWLSFGRIELSVLAFIPMAVSWLWILGIMYLLDIQFNIVNVILATFIFGQGDDYTIFMTEGLVYEYAYKKKMLASYKNSIIISALIMFIGIGSLIVARHPALYSLAEVTIVGMFSVVMMTYVLPPLFFKWLVYKNGAQREVPISLERVLVSAYCFVGLVVQAIVGLVLGVFLRRKFLCRYVHWMARWNFRSIYGVSVGFSNVHHETFERGSILVSSYRSVIDLLLILAISPRLLLVSDSNSKLWRNRILRMVLGNSLVQEVDADKVRAWMAEGYHVVVFFEESNAAERWQEVVCLAKGTGGDVLPVYVHGSRDVWPASSFISSRGKIEVVIGERFVAGKADMEIAYNEEALKVCRRCETATYYKPIVANKYRYKGVGVEREVLSDIKRYGCFAQWVDVAVDKPNIVVVNNGYGALGLFFALAHPEKSVYVCEEDEDKMQIAMNLPYLPKNLKVLGDGEPDNAVFYLFEPDEEMVEKYRECAPVIVRR